MKNKFVRILSKIALWFLGISVGLVLVFKFIPVFYTPLMLTRSIENKMEGKDMVCSHNWVPLDRISRNLQKAVIASEDGRFLTHHGFDFEAIQKAMENNEQGKKLKGGRRQQSHQNSSGRNRRHLAQSAQIQSYQFVGLYQPSQIPHRETHGLCWEVGLLEKNG